jgi:hypothetical protein
MARWAGIVGFIIEVETVPGVWKPITTERKYYGDMIKNTRLLQNSEGTNENINISTDISIVADPYANENFHAIRYVTYMGTKWRVTTATPQYPRIVLSLGGIYNA